MKAFKLWFSQIFTMILFILSTNVFFLAREQNKDTWKVIVCYWLIVTAKNGFDYIFGWFNRE